MDVAQTIRVFPSPASLCDAVGETLGYSQWHTVTQSEINLFAEATGDFQWIHVDTVNAVNGPYGSTIAHGFLTLALIHVLQQEVFSVENKAFGVNYGLDRVRFPSPVRVDSRVRLQTDLMAAEPSGPGIRATLRSTIEVESGTKPAVVAEVIVLYVPA